MTADNSLDSTKIGGKGHFISIDGRPISTTRGVFKDFVKLYKSYYRRCISQNHSAGCSVDPFLCLHLQCPAGNYDVNIEPAKDEVLFTDTRHVRNILEDFLKDVYGDFPDTTEPTTLSPNKKGNSRNSANEQFELLLAKKGQHPKNERAKNASKSEESADVADRTHQTKTGLESWTSAADEVFEQDHKANRQSAASNMLASSEKPHRNMFDFDEDDLGSIEPDSVLTPSDIAEAEDAELRKVSVTNPWSIARLNAPVISNTSPSRNLTGADNEQLMTPSPDTRLIGLNSKTHWESFAPRTNLPSPVRSEAPRSPPIYQNPRPSARRRAPVSQFEEDEIDCTQDSMNDGPTYLHPSSLELSAKAGTRPTQLPPFDRPSTRLDKDGRSGSQHDHGHQNSQDSQTEMQSTQLTDPTGGQEPTLPARVEFRKPFISPFKTPERSATLHLPPRPTPITSLRSKNPSPTRQQRELGQDDRRTISLFSLGHPSPLSQIHQHPMASPPVLQPSPPQLSKSPRLTAHTPHPDLDEIMDFEYRKKAVNAKRRSQYKLNNKHLNSGQLAQIQRNSTAFLPASELSLSSSSPFRKHSAPRSNVRNATENSYNPAKPIGSSASNQDPDSDQEPANHSPQKQSPHQNRYQAAKAALTPFKPPAPLSHPHPPNESESSPEPPDPDFTEPLSHLPKDDPRAYLLQHLSGSRIHPPSSLKIRHTKTSKLPFETIPSTSATHHLNARPSTPFPSLPQLTAQLHHLAAVDPYPRTGRNQFTVWRDANSGSTDLLSVWEGRIEELVREKLVVRLGGMEGQEVPAERKVRLGVVLKAFGEGLG
jgi:DNA mismatch repair protein, C-terminal domain